MDRLKALIAKGSKYKPTIDYFDVFAPVSRIDTTKLLDA